jgi:RNA polymerase sigma factor (sigma-70 family)
VDAQDEIETAERRLALRRAVGRLSAKNRQTVWLHYFEGHSCADVARRLGVPVSTIAGRLHKSRKLLGRDAGLREVVIGAGATSPRLAWTTSALPTGA